MAQKLENKLYVQFLDSADGKSQDIVIGLDRPDRELVENALYYAEQERLKRKYKKHFFHKPKALNSVLFVPTFDENGDAQLTGMTDAEAKAFIANRMQDEESLDRIWSERELGMFTLTAALPICSYDEQVSVLEKDLTLTHRLPDGARDAIAKKLSEASGLAVEDIYVSPQLVTAEQAYEDMKSDEYRVWADFCSQADHFFAHGSTYRKGKYDMQVFGAGVSIRSAAYCVFVSACIRFRRRVPSALMLHFAQQITTPFIDQDDKLFIQLLSTIVPNAAPITHNLVPSGEFEGMFEEHQRNLFQAVRKLHRDLKKGISIGTIRATQNDPGVG